jgi:hypothetical protein
MRVLASRIDSEELPLRDQHQPTFHDRRFGLISRAGRGSCIRNGDHRARRRGPTLRAHAKIALCVTSVADREELRGRRLVAGVAASRMRVPCNPASSGHHHHLKIVKSSQISPDSKIAVMPAQDRQGDAKPCTIGSDAHGFVSISAILPPLAGVPGRQTARKRRLQHARVNWHTQDHLM